LRMAGPGGLEPPQLASKARVLPLDDGPNLYSTWMALDYQGFISIAIKPFFNDKNGLGLIVLFILTGYNLYKKLKRFNK
jgi:hypothetical protein